MRLPARTIKERGR
jgi:hypothetical protein